MALFFKKFSRWMRRSGILLLIIIGGGIGIAVATATHFRVQTKEVISLILSTKNNPYFAQVERAAIEEFKNNDKYELRVFDSTNDEARQKANIQDSLALGAKAILINVVNSETAWESGLKDVSELNIPIIAIDRGIVSPEGKIAQTIASNNLESAKNLAEWFKQEYQTSLNVFHLGGVPGSQAAIDRTNGFAQGYGKEYWSTEIANFDRKEAQDKTGILLTASPDQFKVIFADNDQMAFGAINALEEKNFTSVNTIPLNQQMGTYYVLGFDGEDEAINLIRQGKMVATVKQQPSLMGKIASQSIIKLLNNEIIDKVIDAETLIVHKDNVNMQ